MTTLSEYWDKLARFDWTYNMSEDPGVYRRASKVHSELKQIAKESQEHQDLYKAVEAHGWDSSNSLPERPKDAEIDCKEA